MKIIIFFVLVGLSFADEIECDNPPEPRSNRECFLYAFDHIDGFAKHFKTLLCEYRNGEHANDENVKESYKEFAKILACSGCGADDLLGEGNTFEDLLQDTGDDLKPLAHILDEIVKELKIGEGVAKLLCDLTGDALASECLTAILKKDVPDVTHKLDDLVCKDKDNLSEDDMIRAMRNVGCFGDDTLDTNDAMEELMKTLGEDLKPLLKTTIVLLKEDVINEGSLVNDITCDLTEGVLGKKPLLEGGVNLG